MDGFGPELVAVFLEGVEGDSSDFDRPKAPSACRICEITHSRSWVDSSDNNSSTRLVTREAVVSSSTTIHLTREETFDRIDICLSQSHEFRDLVDPRAHVLALL